MSMLKSFWYCGTKAFFGSIKTWTSIASDSEWNGIRMGKRPTNSGIIPNSIRSRASTCTNVTIATSATAAAAAVHAVLCTLTSVTRTAGLYCASNTKSPNKKKLLSSVLCSFKFSILTVWSYVVFAIIGLVFFCYFHYVCCFFVSCVA